MRIGWPSCLLAGLFAFLFVVGSAVAQEATTARRVATLATDGVRLWWTPGVERAGVTLAIADPSGSVHTFAFAGDELPTLSLFDANGEALPDGTYSWELRVSPPLSELPRAGDAKSDLATVSATRSRPVTSQHGQFRIDGGRVLVPEAEGPGGLVTGEDQIVPDDLIVDGKGCIGLGCTANEAFGGEALLLKQAVVRLRFQDTSTAAGFASTDWQLRANDAGSGGANSFSLEDLSAGTTPLTVKGGAPSSALVVDNDGDLGVGTSTPATAVHVLRTSAPTITLEQNDGTPKEWRLIADGTSFTVRDHTAGTTPLVVGTTIVGTLDAGDAGAGSARPANSALLEVLRHDTDCTALATGAFKAGELCYEKDSDRLFVCEPTDGQCDTATEWRIASSSAGLTVRELDGTPAVAQTGSATLELDQADGFVVSTGAGGAARVDWGPQADQITLGTHTTGNYAGSSSEGGAATTAIALAADPLDCAVGQWAGGIAANGAAAGCTADDDSPDSDAEVPDAVTVTGTVNAGDAGTGTSRPPSGATIQLLRHDTNCTLLAGVFKAGEACFEEDSKRLFVCKPTVGDCDTPGEWVLATDGALNLLVNWGFSPDEHWSEGADQLPWTGWASYTGGSGAFVTPAFSTYSSSYYQVAHNAAGKRAFRYRPAGTAASIVLRSRAGLTYVAGSGVMIDNGVDAGDGQGATSFYRVYLRQAALAGQWTAIEEYRIGGGSVVTNIGPTVPYGQLQGVGLSCFSGGNWSSYSCTPFTFGETGRLQFTGGSPAMSWTPARVGLYAEFSIVDFGSRAVWDWYDEATN